MLLEEVFAEAAQVKKKKSTQKWNLHMLIQ